LFDDDNLDDSLYMTDDLSMIFLIRIVFHDMHQMYHLV